MNPINVPALARRAHPVVEIHNGQPITTSVEVARVFERRHDDVLRAIKNLLTDLSADHARNFAEMVIDVEIGSGATRKSPAYHLTRDGFTLLAFGFTGKKAMAFKLAYIDAFNRMEAELSGHAGQLPLLPADTHRDLQLLVDQLASANHQAIEQAQSLTARMAHATERSKQAHALALAAAHTVAQQVFTAAMDEDADFGLDRWILAVRHGDTGKPVNAIVKPIDRDAYVLSDTGFIEALAAGDVGVTLTNQELSRLAQVALQSIARRAANQGVSTMQVSLNA